MTPYLLCCMLAAVLVVCCSDTGGRSGALFSFAVDEDPGTGWHVATLKAEHPGDQARSLTAKIAVEGGSNLFSLTVGGTEIIDAEDDIARLIDHGRGTPLLFPTPNRVRDATYVFMGETLTMSFPGETHSHWLHGLVIDDTAWTFEEPAVRDDAVVLRTSYLMDESNPRFPAYPFPCVLRVEFALGADGLRIGYEVENTGDAPLGFGFGLHPFWKVIGGKENTFIQVDAPFHMEATGDLLPTGKLDPVDGTIWDLSQPRPVSELALDDVYLGATPESTVRVIYESIGMEIHQRATADFTHIVVYTPNRDYFCVENQTCSTDAHNLYAQGFERESHLQIVEPGKTAGGHVDYDIVFEDGR